MPAIDRVLIDGPVGALEGLVEDTGTDGASYGLLCHPHPLFGGTMENKVVTTVSRALRDAGIPTLRFNFRGVGKSAGAYDGGSGETADAASAASWGARRWPGRSLVIAGFSFGGYVALRLALQLSARQLITIAPAVEHFDVSGLASPDCPWLVIQGDADDVVDPKAVIAWAAGRVPPPKMVLLPGVGHFFHGRLDELRQLVREAVLAPDAAKDG